MLETILEHTHNLFACIDRQFNFIMVNKAYAEANDQDPSFFPGKNYFSLHPNPENEKIFKRVVESGEPDLAYGKPSEFSEHPKRGISYWDWSLIPYKDKQGKVIGLVLSLSDVTSCLKTEKERLGLFRTTVEQSPVTVVITDPEGNIEYVNSKFVQLTGYTEEEAIGKNPRILQSGTHSSKFYKQMWETIKQGKDWRGEFCNRKKNGDLYWEDAQISAIKDEKGNITHFIGIKEDITDRKKTLEALRESEEKFRNLAEQSPNMIFINKQGRIVYANKKSEEIVGYKREEFYSPDFDFLTLIAPESRMMITENFQKHLKGQDVLPYEYSINTKSGKKINAVITTKIINYDGENAILGIVTDITKYKQTEKALKESEEKYRMLAENTADVIYLLDENLQRTYISPSIERLLGYTPEEHIKQKREDFYTPESLELFEKTIRERLEQFKSSFDKEISTTLQLKMKRRDGSFIWVETSARPIFDGKNRFKGLVGISRDITERKQIEEKLESYRDKLVAMVEDRTQKLRQKIEEIKKVEKQAQQQRQELNHVTRVATIGELTASLAHQLNQPLAAILSNAQAAQRFLESGSCDMSEIKEILSSIITEDLRASDVIKGLRAFLKREEVPLEPINVSSIIKETISLMKTDAEIENITLKTDLDSDLPPVLGDRIQLQQVLMNLITNGFDAIMEQDTGHREVVIRASKQDSKTIQVDVKDSGPGIERERLEKIFEPFHTTKSWGMGMGLPINKKIIDYHGGKIWARNDSDGGAIISFTLKKPNIHK